MIEQVTWRRGLAAVGTVLLLGLTACSGSGDPDADDDTSPSEPTSDSTDVTDSPSPTSTVDPTEEGGFAPLPACDQFAQPVVPDAEITEGDSTEGKVCRFSLGTEDDPQGVQLAFIVRGGGEWPKKFKKDALNTMLSEAGEDDRDWESTTEKIKAPGFTYGLRFHQTLGKAERTQLRLFTFAENGDLLQCYTNADERHLDEFRSWCGDVVTAVAP